MWSLRFQKPMPGLVSLLLSPACGSACKLSATAPGPCLPPCSQPWWLVMDQLSENVGKFSITCFLLYVALAEVSLHGYGVVLMVGKKKSQFQTLALKQTASKKWWPYILLFNEESTIGLVWVLWGSIKTQRITSVYYLIPHVTGNMQKPGWAY